LFKALFAIATNFPYLYSQTLNLGNTPKANLSL